MEIKYGDKVRVIKEGFYKGVIGTAVSTYRNYGDEEDTARKFTVEFDKDPKHSDAFKVTELELIK